MKHGPWEEVIQVEYTTYQEKQEIWMILQSAGYEPRVVTIRE